MEIKEAILDIEKKEIEKFLATFHLEYDKDILKTFYITDLEDEIIGTISVSNNTIKDFALNENFQGENLSSKLIDTALSFFRERKVTTYFVFTKPIYKKTFESFGFRILAETNKTIMLEGGIKKLEEEIEQIKNKVSIELAPLNDEADACAIVMNANPITNGHVYLIEEAAKRHNIVLVFLVEEDKSVFSFKERESFAYLATRRLKNVCILRSTPYIVSNLTFPDYFLENPTDKIVENAKIDAIIFRDYFMKSLFIKCRYVGSETKEKMVLYNQTLKEILQDKLEIIDRFSQEGKIVSASTVRSLLENGKIEEALTLVPREISLVLKLTAMMKYGK